MAHKGTERRVGGARPEMDGAITETLYIDRVMAETKVLFCRL